MKPHMCGDDERNFLGVRILMSKHGLGHLQDSEDCALEEQDEPRPERIWYTNKTQEDTQA